MVYNPEPPYEILQNRLLNFATMQKIRRFARYWDLVGNSGNFVETTPLIWSSQTSPFHAFLNWTQWLYSRAGRTDGIALNRLMEFLFEYLTGELNLERREVAEMIWKDYRRGGRIDKPTFLRDFLPLDTQRLRKARKPAGLPKRQSRHQDWNASASR
jgi:hypothetical protein